MILVVIRCYINKYYIYFVIWQMFLSEWGTEKIKSKFYEKKWHYSDALARQDRGAQEVLKIIFNFGSEAAECSEFGTCSIVVGLLSWRVLIGVLCVVMGGRAQCLHNEVGCVFRTVGSDLSEGNSAACGHVVEPKCQTAAFLKSNTSF